MYHLGEISTEVELAMTRHLGGLKSAYLEKQTDYVFDIGGQTDDDTVHFVVFHSST